MRLKQLFEDDGAVSPVIGVILMVAITVILAAVIGTFVLGLGNKVQQTTPQASFNMDFDTDGTVLITHESGDTIKSNDILKVADSSGSSSAEWSGAAGSEVSAGNSFDYCNDGTTASDGCSASSWGSETVRVIWETQNGDNSATLTEQSAP